jgi:transketolase
MGPPTSRSRCCPRSAPFPALDRSVYAPASGVARGCYLLAEATGGPPRAVLMASGSELQLVVEARSKLEAQGVPTRVVSAPCLELFARQPASYRASVLPANVPRVAVEAAHPMAWYRWVGERGDIVAIERFGASAPYQRIYQELGLTTDQVVARTLALLR